MKIKIKGVNYKVKFVDIIDGSEDILGQTRYDDKLILIKCGLGEKVIETIVHEVYHAMLYECGLKHQAWDEELVSWFSYHFEDLFKVMIPVLKNYDKILLKEFEYKIKKN